MKAEAMFELSVDEYIPLVSEAVSGGGEFRLYPKGTSMLPLIRHGVDSVLLTAVNEPKKNDIVLYRRENGQYVLHRIVKLDKGGSYSMCGDNQTVVEHGITRSQMIATVSVVYRGERAVSLSSLAYRSYAFAWSFVPTRVVGLFVFRVIRKIKKAVNRAG